MRQPKNCSANRTQKNTAVRTHPGLFTQALHHSSSKYQQVLRRQHPAQQRVQACSPKNKGAHPPHAYKAAEAPDSWYGSSARPAAPPLLLPSSQDGGSSCRMATSHASH